MVQASAAVSRKSAPQSTTTRSSGSERDEGGGVAVREGQDDGVVAGEHLGVVSSSTRSARGVRWGWIAPSGWPAFDDAVSAPDLELGVLEEEAHDLTSRVPARPGDCDPSHVHDYTELSDSMHPDTARSAPTRLSAVPRTRLWHGLVRRRLTDESRGGGEGQARGSAGPGRGPGSARPSPRPASARARSDATVSMPARTNRPDHASSSPDTRASTSSVTCDGWVHVVRRGVRVHPDASCRCAPPPA